jgi:hypothetical protein
MSADPQNQKSAANWRAIWPVAAVLIALGAGAFFLLPANKPQQKARPGNGAAPNAAAVDCENLTVRLNEAVGNLERGVMQDGKKALASAEPALAALVQEFPGELAAVRNLAVCRTLAYLAVEKPDTDEADSANAAVIAAIAADRMLESKSPIPHILAARVASHRQDLATSIAELDAAAKLAPDDPTIGYELYVAGEATADQDLRKKSRQGLAAALQADPTNSYLLKQQLIAEADEKNAHAVETVTALLREIGPLVPEVKRKLRVDLVATVEQLKAAVAEQKWPQALAKARLIDNVIKSDDWVRSDLRRLRRHPLAYVVLSFSPAVCSEAHVSGDAGDSTDRVPVQFTAAPADRQYPELAGVRNLNISDFDLDGAADVIALTESRLTVLKRTAAGGPWQQSIAIPLERPMRGLLVADLDRDLQVKSKPAAAPAEPEKTVEDADHGKPSYQPADVEVVTFGPGGVTVYRNDIGNDGKRQLGRVEQSAELEGLRNVLAGVLADVDHDGDLDIILSAETGISIWLNSGALKFEEATGRSSLPPADLAATSLVAVDWDRDLDTDILVSGPNDTPAGWLENLRHGALRWRPFDGRLAILTGSSRLNLAEVDGNVSWDLIGTGPKGAKLALTRTPSPGQVEPLDAGELSNKPFSDSLIGDFDNDTHPDLIAWGEQGIQLFRGTGSVRLKESGNGLTPAASKVVTCAAADLDRDGDLDLVVAEADKLVLYENDRGNKNHWLAVRAQGESGDIGFTGDVNHLGIGSVIEIKVGRRYQAQVITGQESHFGLGKDSRVDLLRVIWTNGVPQPVVSPEIDVTLYRLHVIGTSCPYFYTWNGTCFAFCTDACWAAPLGLQLAEGVFAEPRAWEYLNIPGERLVPKDGKYLIQMTEELWEATYLDRMELIVVDHPAEVDIFSNEKVGPAELAAFKIHTVRERRLPRAARDKHGRDVLDEISREDGVFMKGFDAPPRRGLTDEHFLELDLGDLAHPKSVTLFLTGWLYPASTSLRVGVSQDRTAPAPRPPALEVPDQHGNWQVVRPFMGFPGGRTKTIAVDLSDVFLTDEHRVRIVTNMEFYWDAAFISVDEAPAPLELTRLPVASADLHYRGFSEVLENPGFGPPGYDYNHVSTAPKWAPMAGRFTRYGDVTELLQEEDDLQIVFGSGDEVTVAFEVPEKGPRPGWKRDFLLHNVGWDKDNDLNVVTSQAVEPLPFQSMSGYPYRPDEQYPESPRHQEYLRKHQTREQFPMEFWRQVQGYQRSDNGPGK